MKRMILFVLLMVPVVVYSNNNSHPEMSAKIEKISDFAKQDILLQECCAGNDDSCSAFCRDFEFSEIFANTKLGKLFKNCGNDANECPAFLGHIRKKFDYYLLKDLNQ